MWRGGTNKTVNLMDKCGYDTDTDSNTVENNSVTCKSNNGLQKYNKKKTEKLVILRTSY